LLIMALERTNRIVGSNPKYLDLNMPFAEIPGTSLEVSRVAMGTWAIGGWMWGGSQETESIDTIRAALDRGISVVERDQNGAAVYTFADPDNCHCLYVGGQKEYAKLQELRQQRIDDHNQLARRSSFEGGISDLWGPWKPEGLVVK
jgi:hypothetical protein